MYPPKNSAMEVLRRAFNDHKTSLHKGLPTDMYLGEELYKAFEREVIANMRLSGDPEFKGLLFKDARVHQRGTGWTVTCVSA